MNLSDINTVTPFFNAIEGKTMEQGGMDMDEFRRVSKEAFSGLETEKMSRNELTSIIKTIMKDSEKNTIAYNVGRWSLASFINTLTINEWSIIYEATSAYIQKITEGRVNNAKDRLTWIKMMIDRHFYEPESVRNPVIIKIRGIDLTLTQIFPEMFYFMECLKSFFYVLKNVSVSKKLKEYINKMTCNDYFILSKKIRNKDREDISEVEQEFLNLKFFNTTSEMCISNYGPNIEKFCEKHQEYILNPKLAESRMFIPANVFRSSLKKGGKKSKKKIFRKKMNTKRNRKNK